MSERLAVGRKNSEDNMEQAEKKSQVKEGFGGLPFDCFFVIGSSDCD